MRNKRIPGISKLRPICQPAYKFADTIILVYVIRHFSIYLTWFFLQIRITANQISTMSLLFGLAGSFFLLTMQPWYIFFGSSCLIVHTLFDFTDGEVARYAGKNSLTGKYFDDVTHSITVPIVLLCTSFGVFGVLGNIWILFIGCLAAVCEAIIHNVHWGYPNRILYSELLNFIEKHVVTDQSEFGNISLQFNEPKSRTKYSDYLLRLHFLMRRSDLIYKLYEKVWFENRIVNLIIVVGVISPLLSSLSYQYIYVGIFSGILIFYGINRPIVLLQRYLGNFIFSGETLESVMKRNIQKLKDFRFHKNE